MLNLLTAKSFCKVLLQREKVIEMLLSTLLILIMVVVYKTGRSMMLILKVPPEFSVGKVLVDPLTVFCGLCHEDGRHLMFNVILICVASIPILLLQPPMVLPIALLVCCWTGSITHVFWSALQNQPINPLCGASGGAFGLWAVAGLSCLKTKTISGTILGVCYATIIIFGYYESKLEYRDRNISTQAHIGGFLGGVVLICIIP